MPAHSEQFHIRRVFEEITPLLNEHHAKAGFFYYDRSLRKYAVQAGPRTKNRLEFLLENDAELKKAMRKDQDQSNRCRRRQNYRKQCPEECSIHTAGNVPDAGRHTIRGSGRSKRRHEEKQTLHGEVLDRGKSVLRHGKIGRRGEDSRSNQGTSGDIQERKRLWGMWREGAHQPDMPKARDR